MMHLLFTLYSLLPMKVLLPVRIQKTGKSADKREQTEVMLHNNVILL